MNNSVFAQTAKAAAWVTMLVANSSQAAAVSRVTPSQANSPALSWATVINNNDLMPPRYERHFNSYNQPSVNEHDLVVIRARSRGGSAGQPIHGIYTRDMRRSSNLVVSLLDRDTQIPQPNNLAAEFVETPSFPRIDKDTQTIVTRGNHLPVWRYVTGTDPATGEDIETRAGTTGIYTHPYGRLITGASKLGAVPEFAAFAVPGEAPGTPFDVFPGAPSITRGDTIAFKGNYTVEDIGYTGVY